MAARRPLAAGARRRAAAAAAGRVAAPGRAAVPGSGASAGSGGSAGARVDAGGAPRDAAGGARDAGAGRRDTGGAADMGASAGSDTWEGYARGFFTSYCVSCHNDDARGVAARDYHLLANVMREKVEIACGLAKSAADWMQRGCSGFPPARQFPVGNGAKPADADRHCLLRWIDSGTP